MIIGPMTFDLPRTCVTLYCTVMNMMANFAVTWKAKKEAGLMDRLCANSLVPHCVYSPLELSHFNEPYTESYPFFNRGTEAECFNHYIHTSPFGTELSNNFGKLSEL